MVVVVVVVIVVVVVVVVIVEGRSDIAASESALHAPSKQNRQSPSGVGKLACTSHDRDDNGGDGTGVHPDDGSSSSSESPSMQPSTTARQRSSSTPPRVERLKTHYRPPPAPCKCRVDHACPKHDGTGIPTRQQPDSGDIDESGVTATTVAALQWLASITLYTILL
ncbi:hypothetical protein EDB83DRAFT_2309858 [Lactarius deliciosus]|nr:hypothetical protein EDB83DRAFT_2309858 [Lactarius deliciosus]